MSNNVVASLRLLGARVLVMLPPKGYEQDAETGYGYQPAGESAAGLVLAKPVDAYDHVIATRGLVVALGEKRRHVDIDEVIDLLVDSYDLATLRRRLNTLEPATFDVAVGDVVLFPSYAGEVFVRDGITYAILDEAQIAGVLSPEEQDA